MKYNYFKFIPLLFIIGFGIFFYFSLSNDTSKLSSPLIGKKLPSFTVPELLSNGEFMDKDLGGAIPVILNVWASWCIPCRVEHPALMTLANMDEIDVYGLNYKDDEEEAKKFIDELGNPFKKIGIDRSGRTGIDLGVYGIPETFIIKDGHVLYKHIGPIHINEIEEKILPILNKERKQ